MDEAARLARLMALGVLDTSPEPLFDGLVRIAASQCDVPMARIGFIDAERHWFKACVGSDAEASVPRSRSLCAAVFDQGPDGGLVEIGDARADPRFAGHPMVLGAPHVRFYAAVALVMPGGEAVGTLCVVDHRPRVLDATQRRLLSDLAASAVQALLLREKTLTQRGAAPGTGGHLAAIDGDTAQRELLMAQATLQAVFQGSGDAIVILDAEGLVLRWSPGAERMFGYTEAEMLGRPSMLIVPPEDQAALRERRARVAAGQTVPVYEADRIHKDGHLVRVSVNGFALPPVRGSAARHFVIARDVSERRATEDRLRESEQRFRVLTEFSPLGVFHTDARGACTYVNEAWCRIYGMSIESALGPGWASGLHPDDAQRVFDGWNDAAARGAMFSMHFRVRHPGGDVRHVHSRANALHGSGGEISGFVGVVEDTTERHRAQAALEAGRAALRQLYEATPAMLYSCDLQGRLLSVSDLWLQKLGRARSEVVGRSQFDFMDEPSRRYLLHTAWPRLLNEGRIEDVPLRLQGRGGAVMDVVLAACFQSAVVGDDSSEGLRVLAVMEDVTEAKRQRSELQREQALRAELGRRAEELAQLLHERSDMLDVLAHEVRQPLNNASAALQSAQAALGARNTEVLARLERAARVLAAVRSGIDNNLAASALLASDEPLPVEDADVDLLLAMTLGDLDPADRQRVRLLRDSALRTVAMDVSLMRLALRNLLVNALRYSPADSRVKLVVADSDKPLALLFEVHNEGAGFDAAFVPRMFQRGARGARAVGRRVAGGSGLGLYIVNRIMQMHGGHVELARNEPGSVCMRLVLPPAADD